MQTKANQRQYAQKIISPSLKRVARIRGFNDQFRQTMTGGEIVITSGVQALNPDIGLELILKIRAFNAFTPDNDPYEEHDFGRIELAGMSFYWKIDYYDHSYQYGSQDASNPDITKRVMTIMLTSEY